MMNRIKFSECPLYADNKKIFEIIDHPEDCLQLQNDLHSICVSNDMEINVVITISRRINYCL